MAMHTSLLNRVMSFFSFAQKKITQGEKCLEQKKNYLWCMYILLIFYCLSQTATYCPGFTPVVDGTVVPDLPAIIRQSGQYNRVPELIGITKEDAYLFVGAC